MAKVFISPSRYVQGAGELRHLGSYAEKYGKKAMLLVSRGGKSRFGDLLEESFRKSDCGYVLRSFRENAAKKRSGGFRRGWRQRDVI